MSNDRKQITDTRNQIEQLVRFRNSVILLHLPSVIASQLPSLLISHLQNSRFSLPHPRCAIVLPYRTTAGPTSEFFPKLYALRSMHCVFFTLNLDLANRNP